MIYFVVWIMDVTYLALEREGDSFYLTIAISRATATDKRFIIVIKATD